MKDNITLLTGPIDKQRAQLEELKRNIPIQIETLKIIAQLTRARYEALIESGFTPEQALFLCKG